MTRWGVNTVAKKGNRASNKVQGKRAVKRAPDLLPAIEDIKAKGAVSLNQIADDRSEFLAGNFTAPLTDVPIWVVPLPAGTPHRFGSLAAHEVTWSPDGRRIAFAKGHDLCLAAGDDTDVHEIVTVEDWPFRIRWSPDGKVLRFSQVSASGSSSIWEVSLDGSNLHALLPGWSVQPSECCGSWTADGKYYVFESRHGGRRDIWAIQENKGLFAPAP